MKRFFDFNHEAFDEGKFIFRATVVVGVISLVLISLIFIKYGIDPNHNFGFPVF